MSGTSGVRYCIKCPLHRPRYSELTQCNTHMYVLSCLGSCTLCLQPVTDDSDAQTGRMSTQRCAYLMVVAMANRLHEVWISPNPVLLFTYISQFMPATAKWSAMLEYSVLCVVTGVWYFIVLYIDIFLLQVGSVGWKK